MARTAEQHIVDLLGQKDIKIAQMAAQIETLQEQLAAKKPKSLARPALVKSTQSG